MPWAEAMSLAPRLVAVRDDPRADRRALVQLAADCERFSPTVSLEAGDEPETLFMDATGLARLFGGEERLARQVQDFCRARGYGARLAIADTIGLAWAAARFSHVIQDRPDDALLLPPGDRSVLDQLPVEALCIPADAADLLRSLGIERVGQLQALPRASFSARFGTELLVRLDQLSGVAPEALVAVRPPSSRSVTRVLEAPLAERDLLLVVLNQLLGRLTRRFAARDQGALELRCTFDCTGGQSVSTSVRLFQPTACPRQLGELIALRLEQLTLPDEVERVSLHAIQCVRLSARQRELFAKQIPLDAFQLALLVNRLASRLSAERVVRPQLVASALPERAYRYAPAVEGGLRTKPAPAPPGPRPLSLYPRPVALELVAVTPDGPPRYVWLAGVRRRIVSWRGPERIESGWWRGPTVRRDYYRVEVESGGRLWIFRRLADDRWFLHGEFL